MTKGDIISALRPGTAWRETGNHGGKHIFDLVEVRGDSVLMLDRSTQMRLWVKTARFLPKKTKGYGFVPYLRKGAPDG
jgi:hypothetical protein